MQRLDGKPMFHYPKFGLIAKVDEVHNREQRQAANLARGFVALRPELPVDDVDVIMHPVEAEGKVDIEEVDWQQAKELALEKARDQHVEATMNSMIVFMFRPKIASDYSVLYQNSVLIQGRDKIENGASTPRHGWLYDAGADQEPTISDLGRRSPWVMPPMPDGPAIIFFQDRHDAGHAK